MRLLSGLLLLLAACGGNPPPESAVASGSGAPPAPAAAVPPIVRTLHALTVNGTRLTYRINGDSGPAVVFIHGTFGDLNVWGGQEALFAQSYRVLVYSRRYHRPNPRVEDNETYSPKLHAEDLAALLLTLGIEQAHVIGSSYGAYVALALAREHPGLVRSLVLGEPPMFPLLAGVGEGGVVGSAFFSKTLGPARPAFARGDYLAGDRAVFVGGRGGFGRVDLLSPAAGGGRPGSPGGACWWRRASLPPSRCRVPRATTSSPRRCGNTTRRKR